MKHVEEIKNQILKILKDKDGHVYPKPLIEEELAKKLTTTYDTKEITEALFKLIDDFQIGMVLDYPSKESGISVGHPIWHLKIMTEDEVKDLQNLPVIKQALLRLLFRADNSRFPGELPVDEARSLLVEQGYPGEDVEFLYIKDKVQTVSIILQDKSGFVSCFRLIPENEKSEEYKKEHERIQREMDEKYFERQHLWDVIDLVSEILSTLKDTPEGLSRDEIVSKLYTSDKKLIDEAFATALQDGDIKKVDHPSGKEWYRSLVVYDE